MRLSFPNVHKANTIDVTYPLIKPSDAKGPNLILIVDIASKDNKWSALEVDWVVTEIQLTTTDDNIGGGEQ